MTKIDTTICDVCEKEIERGRWARLRRPLWVKMFQHRVLTSKYGWFEQDYDVCGDCWDDLVQIIEKDFLK